MKSSLAAKIRAARQAAGFTQQQVAERLGVTRGAVTQWEARDEDSRTQPSIELLRRFSEVTGVPFSWLIDDAFRAGDVHHARNLQRAGKWHEVQVTMPDQDAPKKATLIEPFAMVTHDEADAGYVPRLARAFWMAVEYQLVSERPELERCFDAPIGRGNGSVRVDYLTDTSLVAFSVLPQGNPSGALRRKIGDLLLQEKLIGRPLRKAILLWTSGDGTIPDAALDLGRSVGVGLHLVRNPKQTIELLAEA